MVGWLLCHLNKCASVSSIKIEIQAGRESAVDFSTGPEPMVYKAKNGHLMVVRWPLLHNTSCPVPYQSAHNTRLVAIAGFSSSQDTLTCVGQRGHTRSRCIFHQETPEERSPCPQETQAVKSLHRTFVAQLVFLSLHAI